MTKTSRAIVVTTGLAAGVAHAQVPKGGGRWRTIEAIDLTKQ